MEKWRLIINEGDAYWNMAIDEAMFILKDKGEIPNTLRLFVFNPSAVTIGYFQRVNDAVNLEFLNERKISITRRITGGGSVYHDVNGEVTYSVVASISDVATDVLKSYEIICKGLVYAIERFGLEAQFVPINDVVVNGKKISGSAQSRKKTALLQHGTFMYNTDLVTLASILKAPKEKLISHGVKSILERVTTLSRELGRTVSKEETIEALIEGFSKALNVEFEKGELMEKEIELARKLVEKYRSREWIFRR